ncbi:VOC family protein [Rhodococcus sp. 24CO]|uniref:VOC family protein n=1 Tax=Rhodococcus sp. 24CO TaxID=3117460 RepID=UPI003D3401B3
MSIDHVLAVVPVRDLAEAAQWYSSLFGRGPDNRPMVNLAEWRVTDTGWVQVMVDTRRAGLALLNLSSISDPDGNTLTFIGGFRIHY